MARRNVKTASARSFSTILYTPRNANWNTGSRSPIRIVEELVTAMQGRAATVGWRWWPIFDPAANRLECGTLRDRGGAGSRSGLNNAPRRVPRRRVGRETTRSVGGGRSADEIACSSGRQRASLDRETMPKRWRSTPFLLVSKAWQGNPGSALYIAPPDRPRATRRPRPPRIEAGRRHDVHGSPAEGTDEGVLRGG